MIQHLQPGGVGTKTCYSWSESFYGCGAGEFSFLDKDRVKDTEKQLKLTCSNAFLLCQENKMCAHN